MLGVSQISTDFRLPDLNENKQSRNENKQSRFWTDSRYISMTTIHNGSSLLLIKTIGRTFE